MEKPYVSIIIPVYNGHNFLEYFSLPSIICQSYKNYEVLVIDDGSEKDYNAIITKFKNKCPGLKLNYIRSEINKGLGSVYNLGIKLSKYNYLAFLEQDDIWLTNKLEKQINFMLANNLLFCNTLGYNFDLSKRKITGIIRGSFSGLVVKKEIFEIDEFFCEDKELLGMQDAELFLKILLAIYNGKIKKSQIKTLEEPLFIFTRHPGSLSTNISNFLQMASRYKNMINKYRLYENTKNKEIRRLFKFWYSHLTFNLILSKDKKDAFLYLKKSLKVRLGLNDFILIILIWLPFKVVLFFCDIYKSLLLTKDKFSLLLKNFKFFNNYRSAKEVIKNIIYE